MEHITVLHKFGIDVIGYMRINMVFRPGYSCESQVTLVCEDIVDSMENEVMLDAIKIDISKAFDLVPQDQLFTKIVASAWN